MQNYRARSLAASVFTILSAVTLTVLGATAASATTTNPAAPHGYGAVSNGPDGNCQKPACNWDLTA
jgi:hypothetical protein